MKGAIVIRRHSVENDLRKFQRWSIDSSGTNTLAEGHMNKMTARSLAYIEESFKSILEPASVMTDFTSNEKTKVIEIRSFDKTETGDPNKVIRKMTLEEGLSSAFRNFCSLTLNLGGVMSDLGSDLTFSQAIRDFTHLGRLRRESASGKQKDAP